VTHPFEFLWIDLGLLAFLAERRPSWTIVQLGRATVDPAPLRRYPNVLLLGRRPYAALPRYCKAFTIGLMPFVVNELTRYVNPIKLRECLAAGLPVVSSGISEADAYPEWCSLAKSPADFLAACERALQSDSPAARAARSAAMGQETRSSGRSPGGAAARARGWPTTGSALPGGTAWPGPRRRRWPEPAPA
jgi:hypothetical protein